MVPKQTRSERWQKSLDTCGHSQPSNHMQRSCNCNFALWCDEPITYAASPRNWLGLARLRLDKAFPAESGEGGVDAGSDRFVFRELGDVFGNRIAISAWFEGDGCEQNVQLQRAQYKRPPPHLRLARFDLGHFAYTAKNTSSRKYISRQMFVVSCQYRKTFNDLSERLRVRLCYRE